MKTAVVFILLAASSAMPASASTAPVPFDEALKAILARDTEIGGAEALQKATEGANLYTRYHLLPTLSLDAIEGRQGPTEVHTTQLVGTAKMNLFKFGADQAALDAARAQERAADFKTRQTRLDRESFAVDQLIGLVRLRMEIEVLTKLEKMEQDSLQVSTQQYKSGRVPMQEMQKVEIDLQNVKSRIGEAQIRLARAESEVARLLGTADITTDWPWKKKIEEWSLKSLGSASDFYQTRPDTMYWSSLLDAQDRLSAKSFRAMLPQLNLSFQYGLTRDTSVSNDFNKGWTGLLTLSINIFNRFSDYSDYRYQSALREGSEISVEENHRRVQAEFDTVPKEFDAARKTALAREDILKVSSKLYQDNLARFRLGKANSNDLTVDLNRYLETELNTIAGWAFAHAAYVKWAHLTGKSVFEL